MACLCRVANFLREGWGGRRGWVGGSGYVVGRDEEGIGWGEVIALGVLDERMGR